MSYMETTYTSSADNGYFVIMTCEAGHRKRVSTEQFQCSPQQKRNVLAKSAQRPCKDCS